MRLSILICAIHVQYVIMCYYMREEEGIRGGDLLRPGGAGGGPGPGAAGGTRGAGAAGVGSARPGSGDSWAAAI